MPDETFNINTMPRKYALGTVLKDLASGFKGVATVRLIPRNRCVQYFITSTVDDKGKIQHGVFDEEQLAPIEGEISGVTEVRTPWPERELLGVQVEDAVTGFKGTITALQEHHNGCNRVEIRPRIGIDQTKFPDTHAIAISDVKFTEEVKSLGGEPKPNGCAATGSLCTKD